MCHKSPRVMSSLHENDREFSRPVIFPSFFMTVVVESHEKGEEVGDREGDMKV